MTIPFVFDNIHSIEVDGLYYTIPQKDEIEKRIALIDNDEYVVSTFGERYLGVTFGLDFIAKHIHDELPTRIFNAISSEENANTGGRFFSYTLSLMQEVVEDWLCSNIQAVKHFSAMAGKVRVEPIQSESYKLTGLRTITEEDEAQYIGDVQYVPDKHKPRELKKRKMLLAALAGLRHERLAEIAYLKDNRDGLGVHLLYMFAAYVQLAAYPALHDGKALEKVRSISGGGRPREKRNALKALLKEICPNYLNDEISYHELWVKIRKKLEATDTVKRRRGSKFRYQYEPTDPTPTAGKIVEELPNGKEKSLGFSGFYIVVRSLRELR